MEKKGLSEAQPCNWPRALAMHLVLVPGYLGTRGLVRFDGYDSVTSEGKTGGPYMTSYLAAYGFPMTVFMQMKQRMIASNGEEKGFGEINGILAGLLGSWGSFDYKSRQQVPQTTGNACFLPGISPLTLGYPSRWYFTGTKGTYWSAPLFLFGHVSSDTSDTFTLLSGEIPIRYSNREPPGNR
jgi:hypothetical protein